MARRVNYHEAAFWEERYKQNVCEWFEWLAPPTQFNAILQEKIPSNANILELGCGSSNLNEKLTTLQHDVTSLDFSKEIIKNRSKANTNSKITYKFHNIQQKLPFEDASFDVIIEKNTIDCLFCQENFVANVLRCIKECYRVLKNNGKMISITHGKQKNRRFFYRNRFSPFNIEVLPLQNKKQNQAQVLIFILTKEGEANGQVEENQDNKSNEEQNGSNDQQNSISKKKQGESAEQEQQPQQEGKKAEEQSQNEAEQHEVKQKEQQQNGQQEGEEEYEFDELHNQEQDQ